MTTRTTEYRHPARDLRDTVRGALLVTSVRVEQGPGHDHVHVWNRGGKAGTLDVTSGDGYAIARLLLPEGIADSSDTPNSEAREP